MALRKRGRSPAATPSAATATPAPVVEPAPAIEPAPAAAIKDWLGDALRARGLTTADVREFDFRSGECCIRTWND